MEPKSVHDTVFIPQLPSIDNATLHIDTITKKSELIYFFSGRSATIPIKHILYDGKQNHSTMKRKGLFTMLLISFQTLSFGQTEWSISAGSSCMWLEHGVSTISNPMWKGFTAGTNLTIRAQKSDWGISLGFSGSYMLPPAKYIQKRQVDQSLSYFEKEFLQVKTDVMLSELNSGLFTASYYQLSLPVTINYQIKHWQPFLGIEYNYTRFNYTIPEQFLQNSFMIDQRDIWFNDFGIKLGTKYSFTRKWGVKLDITQGLLNKHNFFNDYYYPNLGVEEYYFKSVKVDLSLVYSF
jgi:hypothetical protein